MKSFADRQIRPHHGSVDVPAFFAYVASCVMSDGFAGGIGDLRYALLRGGSPFCDCGPTSDVEDGLDQLK